MKGIPENFRCMFPTHHPDWNRLLGAPKTEIHFLVRKGSLWVGAHWSRANRRWCINLIPCCTICIVLKGGQRP